MICGLGPSWPDVIVSTSTGFGGGLGCCAGLEGLSAICFPQDAGERCKEWRKTTGLP